MVTDSEQVCVVTASKCGREEGDISVNYECLQNSAIEDFNGKVCFTYPSYYSLFHKCV